MKTQESGKTTAMVPVFEPQMLFWNNAKPVSGCNRSISGPWLMMKSRHGKYPWRTSLANVADWASSKPTRWVVGVARLAVSTYIAADPRISTRTFASTFSGETPRRKPLAHQAQVTRTASAATQAGIQPQLRIEPSVSATALVWDSHQIPANAATGQA